MMTNTIYELRMETAWQRRRRIRRMMVYDRRTRTGVVMPDGTWRLAALAVGIVLVNAALFVGYWL